MPISFTCPHCGTETNVADQYAGQTGPCGSCGQTITVPAVGAVSPFQGRPQAPPKSSTAGVGLILLVVLALFCLVGGGILVALLLPAVQAAREAARRTQSTNNLKQISQMGATLDAVHRMQCCNNLKQIGLALLNYHDTYKCFPPSVITDENDTPMHSWRVLILPFLDKSVVYDQYDFDEPWDSDANAGLESMRPALYHCPSSDDSDPLATSYVMITGKGTIGGLPNESIRLRDITDGTANTIAVVEVRGAGIHWMEPADLSVDEISTLVNDPTAEGISSDHPGGANVLFTDGAVRFLSDGPSQPPLAPFLTAHGGEPVPAF